MNLQTANGGKRAEATAIPAPGLAMRVIMLSGGISVALVMIALTPVLPKIEAALAHTADERLLVKLLVTVVGITMLLGAPIAGFLVDRIGGKRVLMAAGLIYALGGTAGLYLDTLVPLLASRLIVGLAGGAIAATSMTLINSTFDAAGRAKWMGSHVAVATLAGLVLHPLAGALGEWGWRLPFALYALGLAYTALAAFGLEHGTTIAQPVPNTEKSGEAWYAWFPRRFAVIAVLIGSITYLPTVYIPFVLREAGISSPLLISLVGLGDAILTSVMALNFARARKKLSSERAFIVSYVCTGLGLAIVTIRPSVLGVVIGMGVFGLGIGWFVPNLMTAAAAEVAVHQQGRTVGIVKAAHYLAAPACILAVEPITRAFGPTAALATGSLLSVGLILYTLFSRPSLLAHRAG